MTQGITGAYSINGTNLTLQPSEGKWEAKDVIGRDGSGRAIYPATSDFTLSWGLMSTSEFKQLNDFYEYVSNTGTVVVDLPRWGDTDYTFYSYSGAFVNRPTAGAYFERYVTDVQLLVTSVRT